MASVNFARPPVPINPNILGKEYTGFLEYRERMPFEKRVSFLCSTDSRSSLLTVTVSSSIALLFCYFTFSFSASGDTPQVRKQDTERSLYYVHRREQSHS